MASAKIQLCSYNFEIEDQTQNEVYLHADFEPLPLLRSPSAPMCSSRLLSRPPQGCRCGQSSCTPTSPGHWWKTTPNKNVGKYFNGKNKPLLPACLFEGLDDRVVCASENSKRVQQITFVFIIFCRDFNFTAARTMENIGLVGMDERQKSKSWNKFFDRSSYHADPGTTGEMKVPSFNSTPLSLRNSYDLTNWPSMALCQ